MDAKTRLELRELFRTTQVASIATLHDGAPAVSMAPWAPAAGGPALLIHVSRLAQHTADLLIDPRVAVMLVEAETGGKLPQALQRVMLQGVARAIDRDSSEHETEKSAYLARHPRAEMMFGLGDFSIFAIEPLSIRFVAGFGRAFDVEIEELARAMRDE